MAGSFTERMESLIASTGAGTLSSRVEVDQVYAAYQEFREELRHPRGGQAHYLRDSLYHQIEPIMGNLAGGLLEPEGLKGAGRRNAELISDMVEVLAPVEFNDLRRSGHPTATDDGELYFDRAPHVPRLTEEQLRAKGDRRRMTDMGMT
jgi:hypothetical protein